MDNVSRAALSGVLLTAVFIACTAGASAAAAAAVDTTTRQLIMESAIQPSPTQNIAATLPTPSRTSPTPIVWGDNISLNVANAEFSGDLELWAVDPRARRGRRCRHRSETLRTS